MIPRASASFHPWDPEHILLVASSVKKKRHSDWKAGPVLALSFGSDTGCLVDQSNSPKVQECWLPLIISLNGKRMLGDLEKADCLLSSNVSVYKVAATFGQASDGHTDLPTSCTSSLETCNMPLAPSLPKSISSLFSHQLLKLVG